MAVPPLKKFLVVSKKNLTHDVFELQLERPASSVSDDYALEFKAGQYLSVVVPGAGPGGRNLRRAYSIASPPETPYLELCVKLVEGGPGTNYLNSLKVGDYLEGQAPFGHFVLNHDQTKPCVFIGTGTGVAPHRSMILSQEWQSRAPLAFLLGVRSESDILYPELFNGSTPVLCDHKHVTIALSRPQASSSEALKKVSQHHGGAHITTGRVTAYLETMRSDGFPTAEAHYYLCGNGAMITDVKAWLETQNVTKEQIHTEKYF